MPSVWVQSLVRELRYHMPCCRAEKINENFKKDIAKLITQPKRRRKVIIKAEEEQKVRRHEQKPQMVWPLGTYPEGEQVGLSP